MRPLLVAILSLFVAGFALVAAPPAVATEGMVTITATTWLYDACENVVHFEGTITDSDGSPPIGAVGAGSLVGPTQAQLASLQNGDTFESDEAQITWSDGPALVPEDPGGPGCPPPPPGGP